MKTYGLFILCLIALSGCSSYQETFDCEPGKGMGCISVSKVKAITMEREANGIFQEVGMASLSFTALNNNNPRN